MSEIAAAGRFIALYSLLLLLLLLCVQYVYSKVRLFERTRVGLFVRGRLVAGWGALCSRGITKKKKKNYMCACAYKGSTRACAEFTTMRWTTFGRERGKAEFDGICQVSGICIRCKLWRERAYWCLNDVDGVFIMQVIRRGFNSICRWQKRPTSFVYKLKKNIEYESYYQCDIWFS